MKTFQFKVTLAGEGETPQEAWNNAVEAFSMDCGICPDDEDVELIV